MASDSPLVFDPTVKLGRELQLTRQGAYRSGELNLVASCRCWQSLCYSSAPLDRNI